MLNGSGRAGEAGGLPLGWLGCVTTRWAASRATRERGRVGPLGFGRIVQGNMEFLYIFNSFQYLPPKYDSNSNSNFE
jgi:hypothetical protein